MTSAEFIEHVRKVCADHEVKFIVSTDVSVPVNGLACNGYFDGEEQELAVATGKPEAQWFPTLVHEYCHMTQWIDNCVEWNFGKIESTEAATLVDLWLQNHIEFSDAQKVIMHQGTVVVEHDCERRVLELIKLLDLPIDSKAYAQNANAYILFHHAMMKHRAWYNLGEEPYTNPEIYLNMPTELVEDPMIITPEQMALVEKAAL